MFSTCHLISHSLESNYGLQKVIGVFVTRAVLSNWKNEKSSLPHVRKEREKNSVKRGREDSRLTAMHVFHGVAVASALHFIHHIVCKKKLSVTLKGEAVSSAHF
jgi:hypothetical protein